MTDRVSSLTAALFASWNGITWAEADRRIRAQEQIIGKSAFWRWRQMAEAALAHNPYLERPERVSMLDAEIGVPTHGLNIEPSPSYSEIKNPGYRFFSMAPPELWWMAE